MASKDKIIASVLAGKTSEFRKLVEQYRQPLFRFARELIGDEYDADDITQKVFPVTFDDLESDNAKRASLLTRLLTIARNRYVIYLKRNRPVIYGEAIVIRTSTSSLLIWVQERLRKSP